jgi:hypothetical protein
MAAAARDPRTIARSDPAAHPRVVSSTYRSARRHHPMGLIHRAPVGVRGLAAAGLAGLVMVLVTVVPSSAAAPSPIRLSLPSVSDRSSAAGDPITFRVEYRHRGGLEPVSIVVRVGPATYRMAPESGDGNVRRGITYAVVASPPAGKLDVRFEAVDPDGAAGWLDDGWITVTAPPPPPTPEPTRPPPAAPAVVAGGATTSGGSASGGSEGEGPTPGDPTALVDPAPRSGPTPPEDRFGEARDPGGPAVAIPVTAIPRPARLPVNAATSGDPRAIPSRLAVGPSVWLAAGPIPGLPASVLTADEVMTMVVSTVGGAAMVTAFLLFGRRRPEDDDDDVVAGRSAAASADAALASGAMAVAAGAEPVRGSAADPEAAIPRWRRPSLLEARKHDPARAPEPAPAPRLTFDGAGVQPGGDLERRRIRYRVVRLLDSPDELVASEIGLLDEGDEVALCERSGSYWLVLCPDGSRGWVHRMVLGEVVDADASRDERADARDDELIEPGLAARFTASRPAPTWTYALPATDASAGSMDPDRMDGDVLAAYRAARARA